MLEKFASPALALAMLCSLPACATTASQSTQASAPRTHVSVTRDTPRTSRTTARARPRNERCRTQSFQRGRLNVSQRKARKGDKCIVMVSSTASGGRSRSYLFNSHGMLMTFGVFGKGKVSRSTGARTHFLLPNVQPLRVESRGRRVLVHTSSGHVVRFDTVSGRPDGISGGTFRVTRKVTPRKGGGVTLRSGSGIVVDFGFMRGDSPHREPNGLATLTDGSGRRCKVRNRDLLSYSREEPTLRFSSSGQLRGFLRGRRGTAAQCDALTVSYQ